MRKDLLEAKEFSPILVSFLETNVKSALILERHCGDNDCQGSCNRCSGMVPPITKK